MMETISYTRSGSGYLLGETVRYTSQRYGKLVVIHPGFRSDGATGAKDISSLGWWVHDYLCEFGQFSDGSLCTNWQASMILHDILVEEGRWFRARSWFAATWLFGGGKARENGMW